nr:hypothetical protein [Staphylococcus xylosus]
GNRKRCVKSRGTSPKYLNKKIKKTVQYSVGGASPTDPTGSSNSMAIMVEYDSDTPNFEEEPDKVLQHLENISIQVIGQIKTWYRW